MKSITRQSQSYREYLRISNRKGSGEVASAQTSPVTPLDFDDFVPIIAHKSSCFVKNTVILLPLLVGLMIRSIILTDDKVPGLENAAG